VKMERGKVLLRAHKLINGERRTLYGDPEDSFETIAAFWSTYINAKFDGSVVNLDKYDVALLMVLYKMSREVEAYKDDNWTDMAGYIGLGGDFREIDERKLQGKVGEGEYPGKVLYYNPCMVDLSEQGID